MLPGLTEEQNEYLEALHIKAIDDAIELYRKHGKTRNHRYFEMGEVKFAKARAYYELGDFDPDARLCEM
jgi:hypothetical protein|nr:MAG TPA: pre-rRNA processing protein [Caudoviricetes sp.]